MATTDAPFGYNKLGNPRQVEGRQDFGAPLPEIDFGLRDSADVLPLPATMSLQGTTDAGTRFGGDINNNPKNVSSVPDIRGGGGGDGWTAPMYGPSQAGQFSWSPSQLSILDQYNVSPEQRSALEWRFNRNLQGAQDWYDKGAAQGASTSGGNPYWERDYRKAIAMGRDEQGAINYANQRNNENTTGLHGFSTGNIIQNSLERTGSDQWLQDTLTTPGAMDRAMSQYYANNPGAPGGGGGSGGLPSTPVEGGGGPTLPNWGELPADQLSQMISDRLGGLLSDPNSGIADVGPLPDTALGEAGSSGLEGLINSGGFDPNLLFDVRKSLRENLDSERQASAASIQDQLATRGVARGGTAQEALIKSNEQLTASMDQALRDTATSLGLSAADRQLAASQAAAQIGEAQRTGNMGFMNERDVQRVAATLSAVDTATSRALGIGDLNLRSLSTNMAFQELIFNQRMSLAQFEEAANQARSGNVTSLVQLLLQLGNQLAAGYVW